MGTSGTLLWAGDAASRALLEATAPDFGLALRFCAHRDLATAVGRERVDLVGLELEPEPSRALALLRDLRERAPHVTIFAAASDVAMGVMRAALEAGASDFLSLPLSAPELQKALIKFSQAGAKAAAREGGGEIITVCGARGGLGVTTIAVNLAFRLQGMDDATVALVDLDLQRGDVAAFLNVTPLNSLGSVAAATGQVDSVFLSSTLMRHPGGVFLLPAPPEIEDGDAIGPDTVTLTLGLLRKQFRYTIVDTARTITGVTLAAFEMSERILLLTDLSVPGIRAARRLVELLGRLGTPLERLELLVTEAVAGPVGLQKAEMAVGRTPLLVIPRDEAAASGAMNDGTPLNGKQSPLALAMSELARKLAGVETDRPRAQGRFLGRIFTRTGRAQP